MISPGEMAVENKFKHSKSLFQNADGSNMVFFMRPCNQRQELRPFIEYGGGKVTSKVLKGSIKLAEKGSLVSGDDYVAAHFIEDCVKQNKLFSMDSYRVQPGTRVRSHSGDSNNSKLSFSSNDSMSPASYIVQTTAREWKGRTKYTKEDDIAMITFLMEEKRYSEACGIKVWKDMERQKVTKHSASSMNTRYRKHIIPNIESYKYDVDRRWLSKLSGRSVVKEAEPEFSADALFSPSKRSRRPFSTTTKTHLTGGFGDVFDFSQDDKNQKKVENIKEIQKVNEQKENGDKESEIGNKFVNKKGKEITEEEGGNIPELQNINGKIPNGIRELEVGDKSVNKNRKEIKENHGHSNSEDVAYSKEIKGATNNHDQNENKTISGKCSRVEKECEKHVGEEIYRAYAVEVVLDKLTENEINSGKVVDYQSLEKDRVKDKSPAERKGKGDGTREIPRKPNDSVEQTEESAERKNKDHQKSKLDTNGDQENMEHLDTAVPSPSDIFQIADDSFELEGNDTVKNGKNENSEEGQMVIEIDDGRLTLSQESGDSELSDIEMEPDVQSILKCGKRKADERKTDEADNGITSAKKRLVDSSDKVNENADTQVGKVGNSCEVSENAETQPPEVIEICSNEVTSSGQCIIENSDESGSINISNVNENDSDSFDEMLKSYIKETNIIVVSPLDEEGCSVNEIERDEEVTIVNRQSSKEHNGKQNIGKRKNGEDCTETVSAQEEKKQKLVDECRTIIQTIANKYDLCEDFVRQLLFQCSGDVDRTVSYIEYGPHSPGLPPWRDIDDSALERNPKTEGLILKFGLEDVINRYNFMNYVV